MRRLYLTLLTICWFISSAFAQPAPDFTVTATNGQTYSLYADFLDQGKTVMIEIFFVACPPCIAHAPHLEVLYQDWGAGQNDVEFLALSDKDWDSNADVAAYEQTQGLSYHGVGMDGGAMAALQPYLNGTYGPYFGTPTFIVIAPDGTVEYDILGSGIQGNIDAIDAALAATGAVKPGTQVNHSVGGTVGKPQGGQNVAGVQIFLNDGATPFTTDASGTFQFTEIPEGTSIELEPQKNNNHINGLTTFDIIQISRHILDITPLPSPYHMIAADVNNSGTITTFDLIFLRRMILQIDTAFSQVPSWKFVPTSYNFSNPQNPFLDNIPETITINSLNQNEADLDFHAIKMGDANFSANPLALQSSEPRSTGTPLPIMLENQELVAGQTFQVDFNAQDFEAIIGLQASLAFDATAMQFVDLALDGTALDMQEENFGLTQATEGIIRLSWNQLQSIRVEDGQPLFSLRFVAKKPGNLRSLLSIQPDDMPAEAYTTIGQLRVPQLVFETSSKLLLAPNPIGQEELSVQFQNPAAGLIQCRIYDLHGRLVATPFNEVLDKAAHQLSLDVSRLESGVYQLQLSNRNGLLETARLVKL